MKQLIRLAVALAIVLVLAGRNFGQNGPSSEGAKPDDKAAAPTIVGGWQPVSIVTVLTDGTRKTLFGSTGPLSLIISEKTFTLRSANKIVSDMSYVVDATQSPCTIDLKSADGVMLGVYALDGDRLRIALNDASQGRPKTIDKNACGMAFILERVNGGPLFMINADGTNLHKFFWSPEYTDCGAPAWSPDGKMVAYDTIRSLFGEHWGQSRIVVVDTGSGELKDLGLGVMPSWSRDGKRIAFTGVSASRRGMCIMDADGSNVEQLDPQAQWAKWSPRTDELVYVKDKKLCIFNMKTQSRRTLVDVGADSAISWQPSWSPHAQWICGLKETRSGQKEVFVVNREGQDKGYRVLLPNSSMPNLGDINGNFAFEPKKGLKILASLATSENSKCQLYLLDFEGKAAPERIAGQDSTQSCTSGAWSPDGKRILFCVRSGNYDITTTDR